MNTTFTFNALNKITYINEKADQYYGVDEIM